MYDDDRTVNPMSLPPTGSIPAALARKQVNTRPTAAQTVGQAIGQGARRIGGTVASAIAPYAQAAGEIADAPRQALLGVGEGLFPPSPASAPTAAAPPPEDQGPPAPTSAAPTPTPPEAPAGQAIAVPIPPKVVQPGSIGSPGSDLNPGGFHQQAQADRADTRQGQQSANQALAAQADWANAWTQNRDAQGNARVANFLATNGSTPGAVTGPYEGEDRTGFQIKAATANAKATTAEGALNKAASDIGTAGNRNFVEEAAKLGETQNRGVLATQTAQQQALSQPLNVAGQQQGLAKGVTEQKIAELSLTTHASRQKMIEELSNPNLSDERHGQILDSLLAVEGKPPPPRHAITVVPGGVNPQTMTALPSQAFQLDRYSGKATPLDTLNRPGEGQSMPEGTIRSRQENGKTVKQVFKGGKWVDQ